MFEIYMKYEMFVSYAGMWEESEQMLSEAQARAPQQPDLLLGLAVAAAHSGKPPEASIHIYIQIIHFRELVQGG